MAANPHDRTGAPTPPPVLDQHRYSFTTGVRAGQGYLQADGSLTRSRAGGVVVVRDTAGLHLHHVALDCAACGTARR